jgi:hypothetical protein
MSISRQVDLTSIIQHYKKETGGATASDEWTTIPILRTAQDLIINQLHIGDDSEKHTLLKSASFYTALSELHLHEHFKNIIDSNTIWNAEHADEQIDPQLRCFVNMSNENLIICFIDNGAGFQKYFANPDHPTRKLACINGFADYRKILDPAFNPNSPTSKFEVKKVRSDKSGDSRLKGGRALGLSSITRILHTMAGTLEIGSIEDLRKNNEYLKKIGVTTAAQLATLSLIQHGGVIIMTAPLYKHDLYRQLFSKIQTSHASDIVKKFPQYIRSIEQEEEGIHDLDKSIFKETPEILLNKPISQETIELKNFSNNIMSKLTLTVETKRTTDKTQPKIKITPLTISPRSTIDEPVMDTSVGEPDENYLTLTTPKVNLSITTISPLSSIASLPTDSFFSSASTPPSYHGSKHTKSTTTPRSRYFWDTPKQAENIVKSASEPCFKTKLTDASGSQKTDNPFKRRKTQNGWATC